MKRLLKVTASIIWIGLMIVCCGGVLAHRQPKEQASDDGQEVFRTLASQPECLGLGRRKADGKIILAVLVDPDMSKEQVLAYVEVLREKYKGRLAQLLVYDKKEAFERRADETYPKKEYSHHCLVEFNEDDSAPRWVKDVD